MLAASVWNCTFGWTSIPAVFEFHGPVSTKWLLLISWHFTVSHGNSCGVFGKFGRWWYIYCTPYYVYCTYKVSFVPLHVIFIPRYSCSFYIVDSNQKAIFLKEIQTWNLVLCLYSCAWNMCVLFKSIWGWFPVDSWLIFVQTDWNHAKFQKSSFNQGLLSWMPST